MAIGFDNDAFVKLQSEHIQERIGMFSGKLYLEFGGKLFDDYHASRVLPGFQPDVKIRTLQSISHNCEVIIAVAACDVASGKIRADIGCTYREDVLRLLGEFTKISIPVAGVVITRYQGEPEVDSLRKQLDELGVRSYLHYPIAGYPMDVNLAVSDEGFGKNEFVETTKPLVVVTAPGPGSGKLATCLSQIYGENKRGVRAGYAKWETFPVWNLPLKHPVNLAYEAATADLDDANIIDPFHLEAYGKVAVNYNRDVETFPVLKAMMERILGASPYQSPTDMGVNMAGLAICDDEAVCDAARMEIVRRYFSACVNTKRTGCGADQISKLKMLMKQAGVTPDLSPIRAAALAKEEATGKPAGALMLPNGEVISGRTSTRLGAASSLLLNALKYLADIPEETYIISNEAIDPICHLKTELLHSKNPRLHPDEMLIALSLSSATEPLAARAIEAAEQLRGCDAFFSVIISSADEKLYRTLGINVSCEAKYERSSYYHK